MSGVSKTFKIDKAREIINSVKCQFSSNDPALHMQASFLLTKSICENNEEAYLMRLIKSGVINNMMRIINPENQGYVLQSLEILTKRDMFYTHGLVDETIIGINKCDFSKSKEDATVAINVTYRIVAKVFEINKSQGISLIEQHAGEFLNFIRYSTFDSSALLCAIKLFNAVVKHSARNFKKTNFPVIEYIYIMSVKLLMDIKFDSELDRIRTICCISTSIVSLCYETDYIEHDEELSIFDLIKGITIKEVIPVLQNFDIDIESAEDFIEFLDTVISIREYKDKEICDHLIKNDYLKYLLELSVFAPERHFFRMKVCRVISKIIVGLKECLDLPINDWLGGSAALQSFLLTGLESLPIDSQQWEDVLNEHDQKSNSLLVLLYCHFVATQEKYIFTQKSLAVNLTSVLKKDTRLIFLKALFLLYAVSATSSKIENSPSSSRLYLKAVKSLASLVQKQGRIEFLYTHHEDLLIYSIREIGIPEGLRNKVIRMWLDKSNTDKKFDALMKECLDQGYDELKIVKLLMGFVHENTMENLDNVTAAYAALLRIRNKIIPEVVEFVLKTLVEDLVSYIPSNSTILKTVLRFACTLPNSFSVSARVLRKCATNIGNILIREDTDFVLKVLLITEAAFILRYSVELNDSKIAENFLKNDEFLSEIYKSSFSSKGILMDHSIRTLTCLIFCQKKFNLQCKCVAQVSFKDLETLLIGMIGKNCTPILGVELIKLLLISAVDNPLIILNKPTHPSHLKSIFRVYYLIHNIHNELVPGKEEQIYQCLSAILDNLYAQKINIHGFLICAGTPKFMEIATNRISESNLSSFSFLDFATKWLRYLQAVLEQTGMQIISLAKKSAFILMDFQMEVIKMKDVNHEIVEDFCTAATTISDYYKITNYSDNI